jgi:signal transduction histidine kinase
MCPAGPCRRFGNVEEMRDWGHPWRPDRRGGPVVRKPHGIGLGAAIGAGLFHVLGANDGAVYRPMTPLVYALLLAGPVALLWRRRYPIAVFAVAAAASIGFATFAQPRWTWAVAPAIALFAIARSGRPTAAAVSGAAAYAAYVLICGVFADRLGIAEGARVDTRVALLLPIGLALLIFLGGAAKVRAEHTAEMIKVRAERARVREEQERRQASEERLRIARELHDVLGHHLSLINVQAGVGLHLMDNRPEQAREALTAIKTASAEALREVRAVLGVLRAADEAAPRQPALGLSRLDELTADAGLPVHTKITGEVRDLPPEVDRAAYRIVQEALTNVRRHAGPGATASIGVDYLPTTLHLAIRNDGPQAPAADDAPAGPGGGTGIAGMRARAESLGGTVEAGPVDGGYLVSVLLPALSSSSESLPPEPPPSATTSPSRSSPSPPPSSPSRSVASPSSEET